MAKAPVVLCILDGWGHRADATDNAIAQARTPTYDRLWQSCPRAWLATSGPAVGLPAGQMGNSEIGHMNLGAGRVVMADLPRIDDAIQTGSLAGRPALRDFIRKMQASGGHVHLMGLLSPGGVHSHQDHMVALAAVLRAAQLPVTVHGFLDGRDTPPRSAKEYVAHFEAELAATAPDAQLASLSGRYYAMDRDQRWERIAAAFAAMVHADAPRYRSAAEAITTSYSADISDEFLQPVILGDYAGFAPGDGVLMANFRADRARQLLEALLLPDFSGFDAAHPRLAAALGMGEYSAALAPHLPAIFPPETIADSFGEVLSHAGLAQLRIAETEKYAHVTFFFNGGREAPFAGEDRLLIPSPRVDTYDQKPEMSAAEVTDQLVEAIGSGQYDAIVVNYANPDMVGHTGNLAAAIKAVETIDACLERLQTAILAAGGAMLLTADHGNAELMRDPDTGVPHTAHTHFDVPVLLINRAAMLADGALADVAPTLLELMRQPVPKAMTGRSLLRPAEARIRA